MHGSGYRTPGITIITIYNLYSQDSPYHTYSSHGVLPCLLITFSLAPNSNSKSVILMNPFLIAICKGVFPSLYTQISSYNWWLHSGCQGQLRWEGAVPQCLCCRVGSQYPIKCCFRSRDTGRLKSRICGRAPWYAALARSCRLITRFAVLSCFDLSYKYFSKNT